ncbi:hypothetical protein CTZ29_18440 [Bacillus halotolerans]|nr:hypothetical protein CTZ29_18440 [Bacillus halotolerans]
MGHKLEVKIKWKESKEKTTVSESRFLKIRNKIIKRQPKLVAFCGYFKRHVTIAAFAKVTICIHLKSNKE